MDALRRGRSRRRGDRSDSRPAAQPRILVATSFDGLADEWDELAVRTDAPPFARPGWIRSWWSAFGRGELRIFALRRGRELTAVLPLSSWRRGLHSCSNVHTPLFDGVASASDDLAALLAAALAEDPKGVFLRRLESESMLAVAANRLDEEGQLSLECLEALPSPYVKRTVTWEQYEQSLGKSRRKEVQRRRRRLADNGKLAVETYDGTTDLEAQLGEFVRLEGSGWKAKKGTAIDVLPEIQSFYRDVATWAASRGLLRLTFLRVGDARVAAEYMIDDGAHRHLLKIGYDPEYSRFGPGVILGLDNIRQALADGRSVELGTGMNAIKRELMNAQRTIEHVALFPRSRRGAFARRTAKARHVVYQGARGIWLLRRARDLARAIRARG
jgi:CelD/BcsL family acetyltransferase involved in cellulose biosynthesis